MDKIRVIGGILNGQEEKAVNDIIDSYTDVDYAEVIIAGDFNKSTVDKYLK